MNASLITEKSGETILTVGALYIVIRIAIVIVVFVAIVTILFIYNEIKKMKERQEKISQDMEEIKSSLKLISGENSYRYSQEQQQAEKIRRAKEFFNQ